MDGGDRGYPPPRLVRATTPTAAHQELACLHPRTCRAKALPRASNALCLSVCRECRLLGVGKRFHDEISTGAQRGAEAQYPPGSSGTKKPFTPLDWRNASVAQVR